VDTPETISQLSQRYETAQKIEVLEASPNEKKNGEKPKNA